MKRLKLLEQVDKKYQDIIDKAELYCLSFPGNFSNFNFGPWNLKIKNDNQLSCIDSRNSIFFDLLQNLDKHSFGQVGMPMEKWVFFDCGEMVGGVVGFAVRSGDLDEITLEKYGLGKNNNYDGLIPISMYIAIPMAESGSWFGHNLCSFNSFVPTDKKLPGLAILTKALGIKVLNINRAYGATQWDSGSLNIHTQLAEMNVLSAITPAHSFIKTMTYQSDYSDAKLLDALAGKRASSCCEYDFLLEVSDVKKLKEMQHGIENRALFYRVVGRPQYEKSKTFIPIKIVKD